MGFKSTGFVVSAPDRRLEYRDIAPGSDAAPQGPGNRTAASP
jgi:hypothetical protein